MDRYALEHAPFCCRPRGLTVDLVWGYQTAEQPNHDEQLSILFTNLNYSKLLPPTLTRLDRLRKILVPWTGSLCVSFRSLTTQISRLRWSGSSNACRQQGVHNPSTAGLISIGARKATRRCLRLGRLQRRSGGFNFPIMTSSSCLMWKVALGHACLP